MAVRYCPECRHELAGSGRFCLFCGCDLRKRRPVAGSVSETAAENRTGDSGEAPVGSFPGRQKALPVFLFILLVAAAVLLSVYLGVVKSPASRSGPELRPGLSFTEASEIMERSGYQPDGEPFLNNGRITQSYQSHEAFGTEAWFVSLDVAEGEGSHVAVTYYYADNDIGLNSNSAVFRNLKKELSHRFGDPEFRTLVYDHYYWPAENGHRMLMDSGELIMLTEWFGN